MISCIVVDDDEMARIYLKNLLLGVENLKVMRTCENGFEAISFLKNNKIDLIFLDINMPEFSGIEIVQSIENLPQIIFTSAHAEYALEAFEYHVTDFIKKPIGFERLKKAIDRVKELQMNVDTAKDLQNDIYIRSDGRFLKLDFDNINFIESLGDYVKFITTSKNIHIVHSTLKNIDEKIKNDNFLRVHRSYIVNLTKIKNIQDSTLTIGNKSIPVSRSNKPELLKRIRTI